MSSGGDSQTVGFRYFMGLHFGICYGPIDRFRRFIAGDRKAWAGEVTASGPITISADGLFGGDEREGGLAGTAQVMMGEQTQTLPSAVSSVLPSPSPAFRGVFGLFYDGQVSANNPYIKAMAFKVQRILAGWHGGSCWYPEKAPIGSITPGHGSRTILQSRFTGANATDESASDFGPPTQDGGFIEEGKFVVNIANAYDSTPPSVLVYDNPAIFPNGTDALTFEGFARWFATPNVASTPAIEIDMPAGTQYRFMYMGNAGRLHFKVGTYEYIEPTASLGNVHLAMVFTATEMRAYIAGVKVMTLPRASVPYSTDRIIVRIGDWLGYEGPGSTHFEVSGFRVRNEEVYTGDTFTPPTSIPDPDEAVDSTGDILMNPAHIIYQCVTDPAWGMAYPTGSIDEDSFTAAADTLFAEGFGLCMLWNKSDEIGAFIRTVLDHIGGVFYTDPRTGKFGLKLLRDDYDPDTLPVFDESNIVDLTGFQRVGYGDLINEITVVYRDVVTNKDTPVTVQNLAAVQAQGGVVSQTRQYPGLPNADLALRVAMRDLVAASTPLAKGQLRVNREAWSQFPGDVFKVNWPKLGLSGVIFRALGVDYGTLEDGTLTIEIAEDVFGLPASTYAGQEPPGWEEPDTSPLPIEHQALLEIPYRTIVGAVTAEVLAAIDEDASYFSGLAARPSSTAMSVGIYSRAGAAAYEPHGSGRFVPYAQLGAGLDCDDTTVSLTGGVDLNQVAAGAVAIIGTGASEEWVLVSSIDLGAGTMVVSRGLLDTTPKAHAAGQSIFFGDGTAAPDYVERATGEAVQWKMTTKATGGEQSVDDASAVSATAVQRFFRPYPPGNVKVNGTAYPASTSGTLTFTWSHRDRLQQTAGYVLQSDSNIGPEPGTTYSLELRNATTDALLTTESGITGTTASPVPPQQGTYNVKAKLWAVRDGLASLQAHEFTFSHTNTAPVVGGGGDAITVQTSLVYPPAGATIALARTQAPKAAKPASSWRSTVTLMAHTTSGVVGIGAVLTAQFTRYYTSGGQPYAEATQVGMQFMTSRTRADALLDWGSIATTHPTLLARGWNVFVGGTETIPNVELIGPVGEEWDVFPTPAGTPPNSILFGLEQVITDRGGPAVLVDVPQLVTATVTGSPAPGDLYTITLNGTAFSYRALAGASTTTVAAGLAAVIDASPSFAATSSGGVVTIDGLVGSNAFSYAASASGSRAYAA